MATPLAGAQVFSFFRLSPGQGVAKYCCLRRPGATHQDDAEFVTLFLLILSIALTFESLLHGTSSAERRFECTLYFFVERL